MAISADILFSEEFMLYRVISAVNYTSLDVYFFHTSQVYAHLKFKMWTQLWDFKKIHIYHVISVYSIIYGWYKCKKNCNPYPKINLVVIVFENGNLTKSFIFVRQQLIHWHKLSVHGCYSLYLVCVVQYFQVTSGCGFSPSGQHVTTWAVRSTLSFGVLTCLHGASWWETACSH